LRGGVDRHGQLADLRFTTGITGVAAGVAGFGVGWRAATGVLGLIGTRGTPDDGQRENGCGSKRPGAVSGEKLHCYSLCIRWLSYLEPVARVASQPEQLGDIAVVDRRTVGIGKNVHLLQVGNRGPDVTRALFRVERGVRAEECAFDTEELDRGAHGITGAEVGGI